ncbi:CRPV-201 [Crowpox virus]|nr:CRPV-201 [Crowpox virus]
MKENRFINAIKLYKLRKKRINFISREIYTVIKNS